MAGEESVRMQHDPSRPAARQPAIGLPALLIDHAKPVRVPLLVLAAASAATLGFGQVAELFLIALRLDPGSGRYAGLLAGSAWAGLAIWYAARNAYRFEYPRWPALQEPRGERLREWLPRVLGAAVPLLLVVGYLLAARGVPDGACEAIDGCVEHGWRIAGLLATSLVLIGFFVFRRRMLRAFGIACAARPCDERRCARTTELSRATRRLYAASIGLNVLATVLIAQWPELLDGIGPLAILLAAEGFMCLNGGLLCMLADRRGLPLLSLLLVLAGALHALHLNDNHRVRQYPGMNTHQRPAAAVAETRPAFDAYAQAWLGDRCRDRGPCPVILVAAEGGGIRSAAWTSLVLGRLTAATRAPDGRSRFARHLFAASGVSGGSLGLADYVMLLRHGEDPETRSQPLLDRDYLAPLLANLFFVDFTQRWLPGAWFDDRARALTRAWEHAARRQGLDFAGPFADLYRRPDGSVDVTLPALFFNSTTVAEGSRLVEHPFRPLATPQARPWAAAYDGATWLDPRLPLSEAVLNSARFTYLSPAGTLQTAQMPAPVPAEPQLVDGGYFENSGATTLLEVMQRLRAVADRQGRALRFIVLEISNDPAMGDFVDRHDPAHPLPLYSAACPRAPTLRAAAPSGELSAPPRALLHTRGARGDYARIELLQALRLDAAQPGQGDVLWHFRLCPGGYPIPLGWSISAPVFGELRRQLETNYPWRRMAEALNEQL